MCENNHKVPDLEEITVLVVSWGLPEGIGNKTIKTGCYGVLNLSLARLEIPNLTAYQYNFNISIKNGL
jgi:hypothetical protein